jgi:hypothetical protein
MSRSMVSCLAIALLGPGGAEGLGGGPQEDAKKAAEELRAAIKDTKSYVEKARLILDAAAKGPREAPLARAIGVQLAPAAGDLGFIVPVAAADALGRFRGLAIASQTLIGSLAPYKKNPFMTLRIIAAIGRVGHESAIAFFEEPLKGTDPDAAVAAVRAIADLPISISIDALLREHDRMEKKKAGSSDELKKVYDRCQPEIIKMIQKALNEKYPTAAELQLLWTKRGPALKEKAAADEKAKVAAPADPAAAKAPLAPPLLIELLFRENQGNSTANTGASCGTYVSASVSTPRPTWNASSPPNGGPSSVDFGSAPGPHAIDISAPAGMEHLKNLKSLTITGWINWSDAKEAAGDKFAGAGQRIVSWLAPGKDGVELVLRSDGSLQLGVNQPADASAARSKPSQISLLDAKATDAAAAVRANWRFFAVTYDSNATSQQVKFFMGTQQKDAVEAGAVDFARGTVGSKVAPGLTVGHIPAMLRQAAPDRGFRGLVDEIRVYGSPHDGSGALPLPDLVKIQNREVAAP